MDKVGSVNFHSVAAELREFQQPAEKKPITFSDTSFLGLGTAIQNVTGPLNDFHFSYLLSGPLGSERILFQFVDNTISGNIFIRREK